jgi:hypothetical protein
VAIGAAGMVTAPVTLCRAQAIFAFLATQISPCPAKTGAIEAQIAPELARVPVDAGFFSFRLSGPP